jgi:diguanylate cyclase (GGDEF)-like protein
MPAPAAPSDVNSAPPVLQLLERIERISACRDREMLGFAIIAALHDLFQPDSLTFYRSLRQGQQLSLELIAEHDGKRASCYGLDAGTPPTAVPLESEPMVENAWRSGEPIERAGVFVYPLLVSGGTPYGFFVMRFSTQPGAEVPEAVRRFLRFYSNYLNLLDYSELDSLTGLLNRKTFDEIFDKLLAKLPVDTAGDPGIPIERRKDDCVCDCWLAVIDIDHFKKVNDDFGHLFGDEVLLRLGSLMRATFRKQDFLFRFGGEEFIVVLRHNSRASALQAMDRFRHAVEEHDFPRVGRVTCSAGFTRVDPCVAPIDLVGRADQALYFAKKHGRNRVHCYENLVDDGHLTGLSEGASDSAAIAGDIDALFG